MHPDLRAACRWLAAEGVEAPDPPDPLLGERLYQWYLNRTPLPEPEGPILPFECSLPAALRAAHAGASRFEGGWRVEAVSTLGRVVVRRGDWRRVLEPGEFLAGRKPGARVGPGDAVMVCSRWDWIDDAGFWHTRSGDWPPPRADRLVRVYWNCAPRAAPGLLERLTTVLHVHPDVPYVLKAAAVPDHGGRADAMVLYLDPGGFEAVEGAIRALAQTPDAELRSPRTRMTIPLGPGVGLAEGPVEGDSFGKLRCGVIEASFLSLTTPDRKVAEAVEAAVTKGFGERGLDPERPYLQPRPGRDYV